MKDITKAFEGLIALGAIELVDYLNYSFVEPIKELGFIPKKFAYVYDDSAEEGLYIMTFKLPGELEDGTVTRLRRIMEKGHDDGNDRPYWNFESGRLTVIVPYSS